MPIYTKTGDNGKTSLLGGERFSKSDVVFEVLGGLDELNATISLSLFQLNSNSKIKKSVDGKKIIKALDIVQNDLFYLGSLLAQKNIKKSESDYLSNQTKNFEILIDYLDKKLPPLKNFILPGGSISSSYLHLSRSVCRRVERSYATHVRKSSKDKKYNELGIYLNRLSDMLFMFARMSNKITVVKDKVWIKSQ